MQSLHTKSNDISTKVRLATAKMTENTKKSEFILANLRLYHYAGNNPVRYVDPDGNDIKEITIYNISAGLVAACRISVGVAIDSKYEMAVFVKFELGIGAWISAVDESLLNTLGLSKINYISELYDSVSKLKESSNMLDIDSYIPEDTGKGNLDDFPIESYSFNKIPVSCRRENVKKWKTCPVEACVIIGADGDKDGKTNFSFGAKAIAAAYLLEGTVFLRITETLNDNQQSD